MAHNISFTNGRANIAFRGSRADVWHRLGQEMQPGMTIEEWARAAGLDWQAILVPAIADLSGPEFSHLPDHARHAVVNAAHHVVRSDNGHPLGYVSDRYQPVQPAEVLGWFEEYISADDRFQLDVAGSLKKGEIIWATATFAEPMDVAGDKHVARLLMTTTFDGSGATVNQGTMTRVVCNNTLNAALSDARAVIRTRHSTKFDANRIGKELAQIAQGFDQFKTMGGAMGNTHMAKDQISRFFKACLDIPFDAKKDDVSARKRNQFDELNRAYFTTCQETEPGTAWAALNAITRYVDHDRSTRRDNPEESRFLSAQFGSGAAMKAKAVEVLTTEFSNTKAEDEAAFLRSVNLRSRTFARA
jgi:phage/plasmid-like protein (TIGR03299 family)